MRTLGHVLHSLQYLYLYSIPKHIVDICCLLERVAPNLGNRLAFQALLVCAKLYNASPKFRSSVISSMAAQHFLQPWSARKMPHKVGKCMLQCMGRRKLLLKVVQKVGLQWRNVPSRAFCYALETRLEQRVHCMQELTPALWSWENQYASEPCPGKLVSTAFLCRLPITMTLNTDFLQYRPSYLTYTHCL